MYACSELEKVFAFGSQVVLAIIILVWAWKRAADFSSNLRFDWIIWTTAGREKGESFFQTRRRLRQEWSARMPKK